MPNGHLGKDKGDTQAADQREINDGQRRINGQLCRVDHMLIEIIKQLRLELGKFPVFAKGDLGKIDTLLEEAYITSGKIPDIKPPGCEPQFPPDPKWTATPMKKR